MSEEKVLCHFPNKTKLCDLNCQYYHTCTRSEYRKKESKDDGRTQNVRKDDNR